MLRTLALAAVAGGIAWSQVQKRRGQQGGSTKGKEQQPQEQQQQQQQQQQQRKQQTNGAVAPPPAATTSASAPTPADAEAAAGLPAAYRRMADDFEQNGLDLDQISALLPLFDNAEDSGGALPWPKQYARFDPPMPPGATRLIVIPLPDNDPAVAGLGAQVTAAFMRLLPPGLKVFTNARVDFHITITHFSHFQDLRPDVLSPNGGLPDLSVPAHARPGPSLAQLRAEVAAVERVAADMPTFELKLERVVLARSGTLLLLWSDPTGAAGALRRHLRAAFPGACPKQPTILHSSLFRIVTPRQLDGATIRELAAEAERWSEQVRGRVLRVKLAWHVVEDEFSTIRGERQLLPLGAGSGAV